MAKKRLSKLQKIILERLKLGNAGENPSWHWLGKRKKWSWDKKEDYRSRSVKWWVEQELMKYYGIKSSRSRRHPRYRYFFKEQDLGYFIDRYGVKRKRSGATAFDIAFSNSIKGLIGKGYIEADYDIGVNIKEIRLKS